ncbi:MAG: integration host factor subunit alpha [Desulfobulbaceae bacterium]|nr:integration host factor subunit alpha [Desulfobulbaceae bacterium]
MTVTKASLAETIYESSELNKKQAIKTVETFIRIAKDCLINGEDLLLSGFGKFNIKKKEARRGRNPQTGEDLMLSARKIVTFKPSGRLRDRINAPK